LAIEKYTRADEAKINQLALQIEKLTKRDLEIQAQVEAEATETSSRQIELDRTAEEFRVLHAERQKLVQQWKETIEVPCQDEDVAHRTYGRRVTVYENVDTNDCSEGTLAGGLLGGGLATAISRGKDRWWAIPTGIIGGAMIGCDIDGG